eukprot:CAMPEP_0181239686 /NCGR_PEP_ID=MMETSP1096-20121128/40086_1 /TAXON_ID=156174 ORGANISM="Chrysochromulina ericina, Strain CCMP281" /NCGR_SAMPLE_ID=MMETSP1096 /ASSEMBLY_ACC=CAM_ASM_000453 /LENGTH=201 /DNA_ID=CAMNT_0023335439 /DNA_START=134 /DNA_END=737 /DNA_ORIENTATION=-
MQGALLTPVSVTNELGRAHAHPGSGRRKSDRAAGQGHTDQIWTVDQIWTTASSERRFRLEGNPRAAPSGDRASVRPVLASLGVSGLLSSPSDVALCRGAPPSEAARCLPDEQPDAPPEDRAADLADVDVADGLVDRDAFVDPGGVDPDDVDPDGGAHHRCSAHPDSVSLSKMSSPPSPPVGRAGRAVEAALSPDRLAWRGE